MDINPNRDETKEEDRVLAADGAYQVYMDGSDIDGGVGAAALLYIPGHAALRVLQLHLGPSTWHTVYKAEVAATVLRVELLR